MLHYVIDGYNFLKHPCLTRVLKVREPARDLGAFLLRHNLCGSRANSITIVFDGYPSDGRSRYDDGCLTVVYSCEESADDRIKKIVESAAQPRILVIVTDDRQIQSFAKVCGVTIRGIEEFLEKIGKTESALNKKKAAAKPLLNYSQVDKINKELRKLWLGEE